MHGIVNGIKTILNLISRSMKLVFNPILGIDEDILSRYLCENRNALSEVMF